MNAVNPEQGCYDVGVQRLQAVRGPDPGRLRGDQQLVPVLLPHPGPARETRDTPGILTQRRHRTLVDIYSDEDEAVDIEKRNIDSDFWAARGKREPEADSFWATRG